MATMQDALKLLEQHPAGMLSQAVADALWPGGSLSKRGADKAWNKPHHGGPTGGQRAAAGMLGKMKRRGLVFAHSRSGDPRTWWRLTPDGQVMARRPA